MSLASPSKTSDYVSLTRANPVAGAATPTKTPTNDITSAQTASSATHRRWAPRGARAEAISGAVAHLPLEIQVAFRRKVFAILSLQLLLVTLGVALMTWVPFLHDAWKDALDGSPGWLIAPVAAALVLLALLFKLRARHPWNWLCLALFSLALSVAFAGGDFLLQAVVDAHAFVLFSAGISVWSLIVLALAGVRRRRSSHSNVSNDINANNSSRTERSEALLSPIIIGAAALVLVVAVEVALFVIAGDAFAPVEVLVSVLAMQMMLMLWFAHDAGKMFLKLTPDGYMLGVTYFYTDLLTLLLVLGITVVSCGCADASIAVGAYAAGTAADAGTAAYTLHNAHASDAPAEDEQV